MKLPKSVRNLIESFERLPGIGPKTAARLTYYLLQAPSSEAVNFSQNLANLKTETKVCSVCKNIDENDPCVICAETSRDQTVICVVEKPLDIVALERSGKYKGLYHVLGGAVSPLNNIGPEELYIKELIERLAFSAKRPNDDENSSELNARRLTLAPILEVILATNAHLEGETTALYLAKLVKNKFPKVKVTRIGRGLPVGADLEYADEITLARAMEGRSEY